VVINLVNSSDQNFFFLAYFCIVQELTSTRSMHSLFTFPKRYCQYGLIKNLVLIAKHCLYLLSMEGVETAFVRICFWLKIHPTQTPTSVL